MTIMQRLRDFGHARRYARAYVLERVSALVDAIPCPSWLPAGAVDVLAEAGRAAHDRWLLAGLAWEWRLPDNRVGRDLFAEFAAQRSQWVRPLTTVIAAGVLAPMAAPRACLPVSAADPLEDSERHRLAVLIHAAVHAVDGDQCEGWPDCPSPVEAQAAYDAAGAWYPVEVGA